MQSSSILCMRPEARKTANTGRKGFPFMNIFFHTHNRGLPVVQLRTAFVHFTTFKIIFPQFPQIPKNSRKPES